MGVHIYARTHILPVERKVAKKLGQWDTNGSHWILSIYQPEGPLYRLLLYLILTLLFQVLLYLTSDGKKLRIHLELLG